MLFAIVTEIDPHDTAVHMAVEVRRYRPKTREEVRRNMSAIRAAGNSTEVKLRKEVHRLGLRYRVYPPKVFGRPDFVFPTERIAVFVDGDFWHGRIVREDGIAALKARVRHRPYWIEKMMKRVERDAVVTRTLEESGWLVLRFWESDVRKDVQAYARRIREAVDLCR